MGRRARFSAMRIAWIVLAAGMLLAPAPFAGAQPLEKLTRPLCLNDETPPRVDTDHCGPGSVGTVQIIVRYTDPDGAEVEEDLGPCHEDCDVVIILNLILCHGARVSDVPDGFVETDIPLLEWTEAFVEDEVEKAVAPLSPRDLPAWCLASQAPFVPA